MYVNNDIILIILMRNRLEICEVNEAFEEKDGDLIFSHTKIVGRKCDGYFYAVTNRRYCSKSEIDLAGLEAIPIPPLHIWPPFPKEFTQAPDPIPQSYYIKKPSLINYGDSGEPFSVRQLLANEAEVCEILRTSPHPNVAKYYGCIVHDGRITGLCFARYGSNLLETVKSTRPVDVDRWVNQISQGISHLHSLGLVHCDINPKNVVLDGDTLVIIDFDSCRKEGERLGMKAGTRGWTDESFTVANRQNDYYGLAKIRMFLSDRKTK